MSNNMGYGPWGMPQMTPPWYFPQQQPSDITFEQKLRMYEEVDAYRKRLKDELKASESGKDKEKKEEKKKMWYDRTPLEISLLMLVTFPFWSTGMVNAYSAAFKALGVALSTH